MTDEPEKRAETSEEPGCGQSGSRASAPSPRAAAKPKGRASAPSPRAAAKPKGRASEFARPEGEDDDGYDPWSDRPARREPLFERDPWD